MDPMVIFWICIVIIIFLWVIGAPIFLAFLAGCVFFIIIHPALSLSVIPHTFFGHLDIWPLIALPLFVLAGQIMAHTKSAKYLVEFMDAYVGWCPGGLWVVSAFACMFFGAMTGSGPATAISIGSIMLPSLLEKGYQKNLSMGLIAACGTLGNLIPPSIGLILIGALTEQDITVLFMGGLIPGLLIGVSHSIFSVLIAMKLGLKGSSYTWKDRGAMTWKAIPALITPVIILGGIYGGIFTPTEAAGVACFWAVILGFIYRQATLKAFAEALYTSIRTASALYLLIGSALIFGFILIYLQLPQGLAEWVIEVGMTAKMFLFLCWAMWMVLACVVDAAPIVLISIPTLWPTAMELGIDPVHFGVFMQATIIAGQETPPFGVNLYALASVAKSPVEEIFKGVIPFAILEYLVLLVIMYYPEITIWLPKVLGAM